MAEVTRLAEATSLNQEVEELSGKLEGVDVTPASGFVWKTLQEICPNWKEIREEISATLKELERDLNVKFADYEYDESPNSGSVMLDYTYPYEYPDGHMDCYFLVYKKDRIEHITPCAEKVLEIFNSQHGTDYKLVDCLDICLSRDHQFFHHCNFTAKPDSAPLNAGDFDTKVFFAEIDLDPNGDILPTTYQMLDGVNTKLGCDMCPDVIAHPTSGPDEGLILCKHRPHFVRGDV